MQARLLFITGSDTGAGKTVFAAVLTRQLRDRGVRVAALKPICSGGRDDARTLRKAAGNVLSLEQVNPWHFRAPVAPLLAAQQEQKRVRLREVVTHIRRVAKNFDLVVVEGAGGLLSPLGEGFDSRDLIRALDAEPIVVCPNRLGAVNQALLVLAALPRALARRTPVILSTLQASPSRASNVKLLGQLIGSKRVYELPRLSRSAPASARVRSLLAALEFTLERTFGQAEA